MRPFVFSSTALPSKKAKSLQKAFPFLKLSVAQEATARALGYPSWFECITNGTHGEPSLSDQEAGMDVRVLRYYHQAGELMKVGLSPSNADLWVRAWGLTGNPSLSRDQAIPLYYRWLNEGLIPLEREEITEEEFFERWGDENSDFSKYPEIDRPTKICEGVLLGPNGKYPYFFIDPHLESRMPAYLRGNGGEYHIEDGAEKLAMFIPAFPDEYRSGQVNDLSWVQHHWHYGEKGSTQSTSALLDMESQANQAPDEMFVISICVEPECLDGGEWGKLAVACLKGRDFAEYIRTKGDLDTERVVWFRDVSDKYISLLDFRWFLSGAGDDTVSLPIFKKRSLYKPSLPLYSYPFRYGPMHHDEYSTTSEWASLLPLDEDYGKDERDVDAD